MIYLLIDRYLQGIPACCVYTNNQQAAQDLTTLLFAQGHTNIAFVSPPAEKTSTIEDRLRGFMEAHLVSGAVLNPRHLLTAMLSTLPTSFDDPNQVHYDEHLITAFVADNPDVTAFVQQTVPFGIVEGKSTGSIPSNV